MLIINLVREDLYRFGIKELNLISFMKHFFFSRTPGVRFIINFRMMQYFRKHFKPLAFFLYLRHNKLKFKYGYDISFRVEIGKGFYIGHFGGIVIHGDAIIGKNCNISQGITIGVSNHGNKKGIPIIGDNVFIGPGAVLIGAIKIGNNVTIGANCFVNYNVPNNTTIVNTGSKIIEKDLSNYYIHNRP